MEINMKFLVFAALALSILGCSVSSLEEEKNIILNKDIRNHVVNFNLSSDGKDLVFSVEDISNEGGPMDVLRVLFHTAEYFKDKKFERINLCFRGKVKFILKGVDFKVIGNDFGSQNPIYTLRTFPEKLLLSDGSSAYQRHQGGVLYLMKVQMEDLSGMNEAWYLKELLSEKKAAKDALRPKKFAPDATVF